MVYFNVLLAPHTTDDTAESTESGNVAFHFSLPSVLLRPAVPTAPSPCLESNSESQGENLKGT